MLEDATEFFLVLLVNLLALFNWHEITSLKMWRPWITGTLGNLEAVHCPRCHFLELAGIPGYQSCDADVAKIKGAVEGAAHREGFVIHFCVSSESSSTQTAELGSSLLSFVFVLMGLSNYVCIFFQLTSLIKAGTTEEPINCRLFCSSRSALMALQILRLGAYI